MLLSNGRTCVSKDIFKDKDKDLLCYNLNLELENTFLTKEINEWSS